LKTAFAVAASGRGGRRHEDAMSRRLTFCPDCGAFIPATVDTCGGCGRSAIEADEPPPDASNEPAHLPPLAALEPAMAAVTPPGIPYEVNPTASIASPMVHDASAAPPATRPVLNRNLLLAIVGLLVVLLAAGGYLYFQKALSFHGRLQRAIELNHFFSPPGECAADMYAAEKAKHPDSEEVKAAAQTIRTHLEPLGDEAFRVWYADSEGVDWPFIEKTYAFLSDLSTDARVKSRHEYAAGQLSLLNQNHNAALAHYAEAVRLDPNSVLALNGLAKVYAQDTSPLHNDAMAVQYYERAIAADPQFTWAFKNLGEYYMRVEDWRNAESYMLRALQTSPNRPSVLRALAKVYFNQKDYAKALDYNERYLAVEKKDPVGISRAQAAILQIREKQSH
jgi:tetratricopeptide (TPR) repeat protein